MTLGELRDRVRRVGGMGVDPAVADSFLNERYQRLAAESGWARERFDDVTVIGQSAYEIPNKVVEILEFRISDTPYTRVGLQSLNDLQGGITNLRRGGVYAPQYDNAAAHQVSIYPVPSEDSLPIEFWASTLPDPIVVGEEPNLPADFHIEVAYGAMGDLYEFYDENPEMADRMNQRFEAAIERLRKRANKRVGGGPHFVQIEGIHFTR